MSETTGEPTAAGDPAPAEASKSFPAGKQSRMDMKKWNVMYDQLITYKEANGHCRPPAHHTKLGNWVMFMRRYYTLGKLTPDQIEKLEAIGFQWRLQTHSKPRNPRVTAVADEKFKEMLDKLKAYKEKEGNCAVPVKYEADPTLGFWVKKQRNLKSSNKLRADREKMLDDLGFQWSGRRQSGPLEMPLGGTEGTSDAVKGETDSRVLEVSQAAAEHAREQQTKAEAEV